MYIKKALDTIKEYGDELPNHIGLAMADCLQANNKEKESEQFRKKYGNTYIDFDSLNNQGVKYFKAGKIKEAVKVLRQAAASPEASISVLLNAAQACIKLLETDGSNEMVISDCVRYFKRLDDIAANDKNYARYKKLHTMYKKYELK